MTSKADFKPFSDCGLTNAIEDPSDQKEPLPIKGTDHLYPFPKKEDLSSSKISSGKYAKYKEPLEYSKEDISWVEKVLVSEEELEKIFISKIKAFIGAYDSENYDAILKAQQKLLKFTENHPEFKNRVWPELEKRNFQWGMALCTIQ